MKLETQILIKDKLMQIKKNYTLTVATLLFASSTANAMGCSCFKVTNQIIPMNISASSSNDSLSFNERTIIIIPATPTTKIKIYPEQSLTGIIPSSESYENTFRKTPGALARMMRNNSAEIAVISIYMNRNLQETPVQKSYDELSFESPSSCRSYHSEVSISIHRSNHTTNLKIKVNNQDNLEQGNFDNN